MLRTVTLSATILAIATVAAAQEVKPDDVSFDDYGLVAASLTGGTVGDPAAGQAVFVDRGLGNCVACHEITGSNAAFPGNVGPSLDGAGDRWTAAELRGIVANAKNTFPDTVMPSFYRTSGFIRPGDAFTGNAATGELTPLLTAQQVEDVVAYLATLKE